MSVRNVKRRQWILISLIIGAGFGYIQHLPAADWRSAFGDTLTQQQFEEGLFREQSGLFFARGEERSHVNPKRQTRAVDFDQPDHRRRLRIYPAPADDQADQN